MDVTSIAYLLIVSVISYIVCINGIPYMDTIWVQQVHFLVQSYF